MKNNDKTLFSTLRLYCKVRRCGKFDLPGKFHG